MTKRKSPMMVTLMKVVSKELLYYVGSVEGCCSKSTRHSPARREHWRGKVASAGEAGESTKR